MIICPDVNTEVDTLKQAVMTLLKAGQPVFFGSDVGQSSDRAGGVMDTNLYEFEVRSCLLVSSIFLMCYLLERI